MACLTLQRPAVTSAVRKIGCGTSLTCAMRASIGLTSQRSTAESLNCDGNRAYVSTPNYLRKGAAILRDSSQGRARSVRYGQPVVRQAVVKEDLIPAPALIQLCLGIPSVSRRHGPPARMVNSLPPTRSGLRSPSAGCRCPGLRSPSSLGGNVRVGLEDIVSQPGVYASNAQLVPKLARCIEAMVRGCYPGPGSREAETSHERVGIYRTPVAPEWIATTGTSGMRITVSSSAWLLMR